MLVCLFVHCYVCLVGSSVCLCSCLGMCAGVCSCVSLCLIVDLSVCPSAGLSVSSACRSVCSLSVSVCVCVPVRVRLFWFCACVSVCLLVCRLSLLRVHVSLVRGFLFPFVFLSLLAWRFVCLFVYLPAGLPRHDCGSRPAALPQWGRHGRRCSGAFALSPRDLQPGSL